MSRTVLPVLSLLVFLLAALAGCVGTEDAAPPPPSPGIDPGTVTKDGRDVRLELVETDVLERPFAWQVAEAFGVHVFFGPGDETGTHFEAVVVGDGGASYTLAPSDQQAAKDHAVWDIPIFGEISKDHLTMTGFGGTWKLYDFPLAHEKTWTSTVTVPSFDSFDSSQHDLTFTARYHKGIATPDGPRPGFEIEGTNSDGEVLIRTDYVPALGWNAHFWLYDLATDDPEDYLFHTMSMGHRYNWTGTYYLDEAKELVQAMSVVAVNPDDPSQSMAEPSPYNAFTVSEEATYMYGFIFAGGFSSVSEVLLVDPNQQTHEAQAMIQPMAFDMQFVWFDGPAVPGDWHAVMGGAGVAFFGGVFLWEIKEQALEL